jgi:hypothetical protein
MKVASSHTICTTGMKILVIPIPTTTTTTHVKTLDQQNLHPLSQGVYTDKKNL